MNACYLIDFILEIYPDVSFNKTNNLPTKNVHGMMCHTKILLLCQAIRKLQVKQIILSHHSWLVLPRGPLMLNLLRAEQIRLLERIDYSETRPLFDYSHRKKKEGGNKCKKRMKTIETNAQ